MKPLTASQVAEKHGLTARMLTLTDAAAYCGQSVNDLAALWLTDDGPARTATSPSQEGRG